MKISIFGLGYVGCVSLGCLAEMGHEIIGVDISEYKTNLINNGIPTIIEKDISELIKKHHQKGTISATTNSSYAVMHTDVSIICVGTPSSDNGNLNHESIYQCAEQIGEVLKDKQSFHTILIRSTVMPGTNYKVGEIISKVSGKLRNKHFTVISNPEFLREGSAVQDYFNPPITVLGCENDYGLAIVKEIYQSIKAEIVEVDIGVAEIIKYVNNSYHALKVVFANEIGNICKKIGIDSHKVMEVFCKDHQLNISEYYFKPGFAYGGSCLPKDLKALNTIAIQEQLESHVLSAINLSNEYQKELAYKKIKEYHVNKIGFIGVSFKSGTDDLRYSPMIDLLQRFYRENYQICIFDENVRISLLIGTNKEYLDNHLPNLEQMIEPNLEFVIERSQLIVISQNVKGLKEIIINNPDKIFFDLIRFSDMTSHANYVGLCW